MQSDERDPLTEAVIGAAIDVHRELGPGLLEDMYQQAMGIELGLRGIAFTVQEALQVSYKGIYLGKGKFMDIVVQDNLVLELKAVDTFVSVHQAQFLTYMKLRGTRKGLLINFNVPLLKDGIKRMVL
ncbi:MAG TPA: GxxExxY protein [Gemmataceae bacterium]|jgi:GxxExxY protein|nr:GxxExxY protein [Gemmataceae bacterium]